jgi:hypothetical protein
MHGPTCTFWASLTFFSLKDGSGISSGFIPTGASGGGTHQPGVLKSFYTVFGCHWLSFFRDLHSSPSVIAVSFCQNVTV